MAQPLRYLSSDAEEEGPGLYSSLVRKHGPPGLPCPRTPLLPDALDHADDKDGAE